MKNDQLKKGKETQLALWWLYGRFQWWNGLVNGLQKHSIHMLHTVNLEAAWG